jgi:hypothetical protein
VCKKGYVEECTQVRRVTKAVALNLVSLAKMSLKKGYVEELNVGGYYALKESASNKISRSSLIAHRSS